MKKYRFKLLAIAALSAMISTNARAQSIADCIEQLTLDYQKLATLKSILSQMYKGYILLDKGYSSVRDVSQGNFTLHKAFLDGLLAVSPTVRKYPRIADIMSDQSAVVSEHWQAYRAFCNGGQFSPDELSYMLEVYKHLISSSMQNLDDLATVITDGKLRMSDAERLSEIDRIYASSHNQLSFLRRFNNQASKTAAQRENNHQDRSNIKNLYGIK